MYMKENSNNGCPSVRETLAELQWTGSQVSSIKETIGNTTTCPKEEPYTSFYTMTATAQ
jgi:hypothetical protein